MPSVPPMSGRQGRAFPYSLFVDEIVAAARGIRKDVIVLCHGGPVAEPEDAAFILGHCREVDGFYGASSLERLPTERAIREQTEKFTRLLLKKA